LPNVDTSTVLALFNVQCPSHDEENKIPLPNPGEQVSLRFPKSNTLEAGKTPYEEVWLGCLINLPVGVDEFNMAALIRRPDNSKITVLNSVSTEEIHFEFRETITSDAMEGYIASLLYGQSVPKGDPDFLRTLLGRNNFETPKLMPFRADMTPEQISEFDDLLKEVTAGNNPSQERAVAYAMDHFLTLVKGPPGTGKSHTILQLMELFANKGLKVLILAPSNSATEHNADKSKETWFDRKYNPKEIHWIKKVMDEKMTITSEAAHPRFTQPPGRVHILGLEDAPSDVMTLFQEEIVQNALGDPHGLSLKARIMQELELAAQKPTSWRSTESVALFRALEDQEFLILTSLAALMGCEKTGQYELHHYTKAAIKSLGFDLSPKKPWPRARQYSTTRERSDMFGGLPSGSMLGSFLPLY
jgi:hypothetical protein